VINLSEGSKTKLIGLILIIVIIAGVAAGVYYFYYARKAPTKLTIITSAPLVRAIYYYEEDVETELGFELEVVEVPYGEMYEKVMTDVQTGAGQFDIFLIPNDWIGDLATGGYVIQLDDYIEADDPALDDYLPHIREKLMKWGGHYYCLAFDGDCHILFYRKDLWENTTIQQMFEDQYGYPLPDPPKTWDQVIHCAEFFNGWDWDGDGEVEYGIGISCKRHAQSPWTAIDFAAPYTVIPGAPSKYKGVLYFDPETMDPLVNTPGWIRGFEKFSEVIKHGPPGIKDFDVSDVRARFTRGELAMGIDWTDMGPLSIAEDSVVAGKVTFAMLPGSMEVYDRETGTWKTLTEPNQIAILNFGGWSFFISKYCKNPELAYKYIKWMVMPEHSNYLAIAKGETGVNIFRYSQFYDENPDLWLEVGWDEASAKQYCNIIKSIYENPYAVWDIRIPGFQRFWDALDTAMSEIAAGTKTPSDAAAWLYDEWNSIIEDLGKDDLLGYYREDLGLPPLGSFVSQATMPLIPSLVTADVSLTTGVKF